MIEKRASINITSWFNFWPQGHQARLFARPRKAFRDYFALDPVFPPHLFRKRFRMSHPLFFHLQSTLEAHDLYFI